MPRNPLVKVLYPYIAAQRNALICIVAMQIAATALSLAIPALNAYLIDEGIATGNLRRVWLAVGVMAIVTVADLAISICVTLLSARVSTETARVLRRRIFRHVSQLSRSDTDEFGTGSLLTRSTNDVLQLQNVAFLTATIFVTAPIITVGGLVMALSVSVYPAPVLLVTATALSVVVIVVLRRLIPLFIRQQSAIDTVNQIVREQLDGVRLVRGFRREQTEQKRFAKVNLELTQLLRAAGNYNALLMPAILLVSNIGSLAVVACGAILVGSNDLEVGQIVAYLAYLGQILAGVSMATVLIAVLPRARVSAERIGQVLDAQPSIVDPEYPVYPHRRGLIEFCNAAVQKADADEPILAGVNLTCQAGTTTTIIGPTGSGKSTLLQLVPRLQDVSTGAVRVDGVDVRQQCRSDLWSAIGWVSQVPTLVSGDIASNIRLGDPQATDEDIWHVLEVVEVADFIRQDGRGLSYPVMRLGANLSGGQRQRVALARVLIRHPKVYLLDDPFSALDTKTEAKVRRNLDDYIDDGATVIHATQRAASVGRSDRVVVLDAGTVSDQGTPAEVAGRSRVYRELLLTQRPSHEETRID